MHQGIQPSPARCRRETFHGANCFLRNLYCGFAFLRNQGNFTLGERKLSRSDDYLAHAHRHMKLALEATNPQRKTLHSVLARGYLHLSELVRKEESTDRSE